MADEFEEINNEEIVEEPTKYEELAEELPPREINFEDFQLPKTLTEEEEETIQKTDIQSILRALQPLMPSPRMRELLQPALVSRVFADNYMDKHFLLSAALIEECDVDGDVDVVGIISITQDILSKAFEGRHIIDLLELAGVAHEDEMAKLSKELGL